MKCQCQECRELAAEMSANAEALGELRFDEIAPIAIRIPGRRPVYPWLAAAAALTALAVALPMLRKEPKRAPVEPTPTMTIKMLTPDPTVVIYWLADTKDVKEEKR
jgi:hypothetical protein